MKFVTLFLPILLGIGAQPVIGQIPGPITNSKSPGGTAPPPQGVPGPPLDLLSQSHAGSGLGEPPEPQSEPHFENEPENPPTQRFWASTEYLLWWIKDSTFPVLLTVGSVNDAQPGAVGMPGTGVLFGGSTIDNKDRSGARLGLGYWIDDGKQFGVEAGGFYLSDRSVGTFASSNGNLGSRLLARPFFNVTTNQEDASIVAFPGVVGGNVNIGSSSEMHSAECNGLWNLTRRELLFIDVLAGFRYLDLRENININEVSQIQSTAPLFPNQQIIVTDRFGGSNLFYGGQVGLRSGVTRDRWSVEVTAKVALGISNETVNIGGTTSIQSPGQPATTFGSGLLALGSNSGRFVQDQFAVVPQVDAKFGFQITSNLRVTVGYSFVYWSSVNRPADQIDRGLAVTQIPTSTQFAGNTGGAVRPTFAFHDTDFWAHGLNVGLEFRY